MAEEQVQNSVQVPHSETPDRETRELRNILIIIAIFALLLIAIIYVPRWIAGKPKTAGELLIENLNKKPTDRNYVYQGFSFIKLKEPQTSREFWHTELTANGETYELLMHYGPKELLNLPIASLKPTVMRNYSEMYITIDPKNSTEVRQYVALSVSEFSEKLAKVKNYPLVAACTRNETAACETRPIVDCGTDNNSIIVKFDDSDNQSKVIIDDNCFTVYGQGEGMLMATDKLIYRFMGIA